MKKRQLRKIRTNILLHQFPQTPLVYPFHFQTSLSLLKTHHLQTLRIPEELSDTKQLEPRAAPTSTPGNQDDMDALLPPPEQTEEAEIQKGINESPVTRDGKEEKEEKEEKEKGKGEWKEKKATNL
jgi:hypothetical protein